MASSYTSTGVWPRWIVCMGAATIMFVLVAECCADGDPLDADLHRVDAMRAGEDTPFDKVEAECQRLLQSYTKPEEQGRILFLLAHVYAQSGHVRPDQSIHWAKKALEYPLDPESKQLAYVYWGDAIQLSRRGVRGQQLAAVRREAVLPYLQGLKELLAYELPELPSEPAVVEPFVWSGSKDDPQYQKRLRAYQAQADAAKNARIQNRMIRYRDTQTGQIAYMYSRLPFATNELEALAKDVLKDDAAVNRLMARVKECVQKRIEALGGGIPEELPKELDAAYVPSAPELRDESIPQEFENSSVAEAGRTQELQDSSKVGGNSRSNNLALPIAIMCVLAGVVCVGMILWRRRTARCGK